MKVKKKSRVPFSGPLTAMQGEGLGSHRLATPPLYPIDPLLESIDCLLGQPGACDLGTTVGTDRNVAYNTAVASDIAASRGDLSTGLALTFPTDYLALPVWFRRVDRLPPLPPGPPGALAHSAGFVNGLYPEPAFVAPDTYGPYEDQPLDRFVLDMDQSFAGADLVTPWYVNDWHWYHLLEGEVHCGTNTIRAIPAEHWWESP